VLVDLHTHSSESDGWLEPAEVVAAAADSGVQVVALSDHDCVAGVARAWREAEKRGLGFVPALEITTYPLFSMRHILGHGIDIHDRSLRRLAERNQAVWRAQSLCCLSLLRDEGVRDPDLHALGDRRMLMPNVLVRFLIQRLRMTPEAAWDLIHRGLETVGDEVYSAMPGPVEAVEAIHAAGGLAVCAHPGSVADQSLLDEVLPLVDGMEVYTYRHSEEQVERYRELARRHDLLPTVGTDFHAYLDAGYRAPAWEAADGYVGWLAERVSWPATRDDGPAVSRDPR
jgi:predicted metal-dependent phosphoesterase TrpH